MSKGVAAFSGLVSGQAESHWCGDALPGMHLWRATCSAPLHLATAP